MPPCPAARLRGALSGLRGALSIEVHQRKQIRNKMSDSDGKLRAPTWDGTGDKSRQYLLKTKALAVYYRYGDTFEQTTMVSAPTNSEYNAFVTGMTVPTEVAEIKLYEVNRKMAAIIISGQMSDHGLAMMESRITMD